MEALLGGSTQTACWIVSLGVSSITNTNTEYSCCSLISAVSIYLLSLNSVTVMNLLCPGWPEMTSQRIPGEYLEQWEPEGQEGGSPYHISQS